MKLTKAQRAKDEQILAAIIAGGVSSGRKIAPHHNQNRPTDDGGLRRFVDGTHVGFIGYRGAYPSEGEHELCACAVGAGVLFRDQVRADQYAHNGILRFAEIHDVSLEYARGVSDGFEVNDAYDAYRAFRPAAFVGPRDINHDYQRGVDVGRAAFAYFHWQGDIVELPMFT